jgi:hypothetical protein
MLASAFAFGSHTQLGNAIKAFNGHWHWIYFCVVTATHVALRATNKFDACASPLVASGVQHVTNTPVQLRV